MDLSLFSDIQMTYRRWEKSRGRDRILCSGWAYLTLWRPDCLGRLTVSQIGHFRLSFTKRSKLVLRDALSILTARAPVIKYNAKVRPTRTALLFSWFHGNDGELLKDRYLGPMGSDLPECVGRIYICDGPTHGKFQNNVDAYYVWQRTLGWNLLWILRAVAQALSHSHQGTKRAMWSVEARNAHYIANQLQEYLGQSAIDISTVIFPYEQQPWQCELIKFFRKRKNPARIIGYIHSSLNNLPSQFCKHLYTPDALFVHGTAFKRVLTNYLGWQHDHVHLIKSIRYQKPFVIDNTTVFMPYGFQDEGIILNSLQCLVENGVALQGCDIRIHPDKISESKHKMLSTRIAAIVQNAISSNDFVVVTVGVTTVTLEAVEAGFTVYAIFDRPEMDALEAELWPELEVTKINHHTYRYALKEAGAFIDVAQNLQSSKSIISLIDRESPTQSDLPQR